MIKDIEVKDYIIDGRTIQFKREKRPCGLLVFQDGAELWVCGYYNELPSQEQAQRYVHNVPLEVEAFKIYREAQDIIDNEKVLYANSNNRYFRNPYQFFSVEGCKMMYKYGMRLRGFAPGCQPREGLEMAYEPKDRRYYSILVYSRKLTEKEISDYELDPIPPGDKK